MANVRIADATRDDMMDAINAALNAGAGAGTCKVYTGTQPADANTGLAGNTLLATLTLDDPATGASSNGVITFSTITEDSAADATGTATWARLADSDGNTVLDCDVHTSTGTINLNTTSIVTGGPVRITSGTLTLPAS